MNPITASMFLCNHFQYTNAALYSIQPGKSSKYILRQFDWLLIEFRERNKLVSVMYKVQTHGSPTYLSQLINGYVPFCELCSPGANLALCSSGANLHTVVRCNLTFGSRSFHVATPTVWNSLPQNVRLSTSLTSFCRNLKTFLLKSAFSAP